MDKRTKDLEVEKETFKKEEECLKKLSTSLETSMKDFMLQTHKITEILNRENFEKKIEKALEKIEELEEAFNIAETDKETALNTIADVLEDLILNANGKTNERISKLAELIRDSQSDLSEKSKVLTRLY